MIQLDPELWTKRILFFILAFLAIVVGVQAFQCYSVGKYVLTAFMKQRLNLDV